MARPKPEEDFAAVVALAEALKLGPVAPVVLKLAHHTTVWLSPLPVVARVQSSEPPDRAAAAMAREIALARHLTARGAPAVAPTRDPPPGPHLQGRAATTLWTHVEHRPPRGEADEVAAARALGRVHAALADYQGELPAFTRHLDHCDKLLGDAAAMPAIAPADRAFLAERLAALSEGLATFSFAAIPLHGDTHVGNVLFTAQGPIWADLEAICLGPLEWDLVQLAPGARRVFGAADAALLEHLADLRSATVAVWCWADAGRSDDVRAAAEYHLARLRRRTGRRLGG
jgi:hypothetical protein